MAKKRYGLLILYHNNTNVLWNKLSFPDQQIESGFNPYLKLCIIWSITDNPYIRLLLLNPPNLKLLLSNQYLKLLLCNSYLIRDNAAMSDCSPPCFITSTIQSTLAIYADKTMLNISWQRVGILPSLSDICITLMYLSHSSLHVMGLICVGCFADNTIYYNKW
jgi:hypothetical protein